MAGVIEITVWKIRKCETELIDMIEKIKKLSIDAQGAERVNRLLISINTEG